MVVVLFVCTGNAARSQMAEGLLRHIEPKFKVLSAGTKPEGVSEYAIKVMQESGIDISHHTSDNISNLDWESADYAITLCDSANGICVSMPWPESCVRKHWPIDDPVSIEDYRIARDRIKEKILSFLKTI